MSIFEIVSILFSKNLQNHKKRNSGDKLEIRKNVFKMKLLRAVFSALTLQSVNALQCWTCEEKSHADCLTYGVSINKKKFGHILSDI